MRKYKTPRCKIRQDLSDYKIPVWKKEGINTLDMYIWGSKRTFEYRWISKDAMQIKFGRKWYNCYSIDFDFIN